MSQSSSWELLDASISNAQELFVDGGYRGRPVLMLDGVSAVVEVHERLEIGGHDAARLGSCAIGRQVLLIPRMI